MNNYSDFNRAIYISEPIINFRESSTSLWQRLILPELVLGINKLGVVDVTRVHCVLYHINSH